MVGESPRDAKARKLRENKQRCRDAAARWRHEINQGRYRGMPSLGYGDLTYISAMLDTAAQELDRMPPAHQRAVLAFVTRLLDDKRDKPGPTPPLSAGDGV